MLKPNLLRRVLLPVALLACLGLLAPSHGPAQGYGDAREFRETPYFLVLLVIATGLDYQNQPNLLRSLRKSQLKGGFLGHAWVLLSGIENGRRQIAAAGLSPKEESSMQFLRGVLDLAESGHADPISFLWRDHGNGHLQPAREIWIPPTYAAKLDLDFEQYRRIKARLDPTLPSHKSFQITGQQCSSFVAELAALAGVNLKHQVTIPIPRELQANGKQVRMWTDPKYSSITLSSPDVIEEDLKRLVASGQAQDALAWYLARTHELP